MDVASWILDPDPDPAEQVVSHLVRDEVREALAQLAPNQRRLLELAYFTGLTQSEMAKHLDRPLGTVKTQIRTAMQHLAALLVAVDPDLGGRATDDAGAGQDRDRPRGAARSGG